MIFGDNHDMSRIYTQMNEDVQLWKMAMTYILTMRGIPQIYYGTEILMSNKGTESHGVIRSDMPGGWQGDTMNVFTGLGLAEEKVQAQQWLKKILNWRKDKTSIHEGKLLHSDTVEEAYVFFRFNEEELLMVVLNRNEGEILLPLNRFQEILPAKATYKEVLTDEEGNFDTHLRLKAKQAYVFEILR